MADLRATLLLTLVGWAAVGAAAELFPLDACPAGDGASTMDGLYCSALPLEFATDGIYHMRQVDGSVTKVYCDMTGGRWNEVMRRGAHANRTAIPAATQLSFAGEAAEAGAGARYQGFYGDLTSEFFVGTDQLSRFGGFGTGSELLVELETDSQYYFAIFGFKSLNPIDLGEYLLGTAGHGQMKKLSSFPFNTACNEAWFASDCDAQDALPRLTRPLDDTARAVGDYDWFHIDQPLKTISLKVRVNDGQFCTSAQSLKFGPELLESFDTTMTPSITTPEVAAAASTETPMPTSITFTCKDASKVITTLNQYEAKDYAGQSVTKTFNCQPSGASQLADFDDEPLTRDVCMAPCKAGYTLVAPTVWSDTTSGTSSTVERASCLSPLRGPAGLGPYQAAKLCSDAGEQLLDFPVPRDRLDDTTDEVGLITAMHYSLHPQDNIKIIRDLRGTFFKSHPFDDAAGGDYKADDRCVGLFVDNTKEHEMVVHQTACYNETLKFVCMSDVGCAPDQILVDGFCYEKIVSKLKDQEKTCYPDPNSVDARNGMPAAPTAALLDMLASMEPIALPVAVGAYRRNGGFFQMDQSIPASDIGGIEEDANECAVLDTASKQLTAIACNDGDERVVICQYPGLPTDECPTLMREKYSTAIETGDKDPNSKDQISEITAKSGFNFYEREGMHTLEYKCIGLAKDWELQTSLDTLTNPDVRPWEAPQVMACITENQGSYPANSNFSVTSIYLVHRCIALLQTSNTETEQQQTCNHDTKQFSGAVVDCDECLMDPFPVTPAMPMNSSWDGLARSLGQQVNYTCDPGLATSNGTTVQRQTCTLNGWVGDVVPCDTCVWLDSFNSSSLNTTLNATLTDGLQFGSLVEMACLSGLEAADGSVFSTAVCTPDAWNLCHDNFTCDHCHGPPVNASDVAFVAGSDWDGSARQQGTVVTYSCEGSSVTETGQQQQQQNCTDLGWIGDVLPCGVCPGEPVNATQAMTQVWNGSRTFGAEAWYHCNAGVSAADGNTSQSQRCATAGWQGDVQPCDSCVGQPFNVTGLTAITSDFSGDTAVDTQVTYSCQGPLTTVAGQVNQTVNCTQNGWLGDVQPCEVCPPPPNGTHATIRAVDASRNDGDRLGSSVTYRCNRHLYTEDGQAEIVAVCETDGWSVCEPEIRCNYCSHLGDVGRYRGTLTWDYTGVRELGTEVTLTCGDGLATPDLNTTQTLTCGLNGWNQAVPCSICTDPAPTPPPSMEPNVTWTLGDESALYTCIDTKKLAWGLTEFELSCSATGWLCAPPCDYCAATPPPPAGLFPLDMFDNPGGQASYECNTNLQTALNQTVQTLTCAEAGWEGELLPCDECVGDVTAPSPGQNRTWSGNTTIGTSVTYECLPGKETQENTTFQTRNCTDAGWTPPPLPCDLCVVPRVAYAYMTRDWDGNRTVNSTVTYTCHGNLTTMANETTQTLTCTDDGWSAALQSCALCRDPIPEAGNSTERNLTQWTNARLPGATLEYLCYTGTVQTVTCNGGAWEPEELPPCCGRSSVQRPPSAQGNSRPSNEISSSQRHPSAQGNSRPSNETSSSQRHPSVQCNSRPSNETSSQRPPSAQCNSRPSNETSSPQRPPSV